MLLLSFNLRFILFLFLVVGKTDENNQCLKQGRKFEIDVAACDFKRYERRRKRCGRGRTKSPRPSPTVLANAMNFKSR